MALSITITDAGRAALINAQNTGSTAMVIDRIGVSASHATGNLKALTTLPNERKKLATFAGEVVANDMIHVTVRDETNDAYDLRAFGIYFANGVLFAVCTQAEPIMQKAAAAMLLQSVDIALVTLDTANIEFGGAGFSNPPATTERLGVVELATVEETAALEDATRAVTPFGLGRTLLAWAQNFASRLHGHGVGDVDGLGLALAGKAAKDHKHDAADIQTGTFEVARIPKLAIAWISGLADTLATLALKDHKHDAADLSSGVLAVGRIPALAMEKITGLAAVLASKANVQNPDFWGQFNLESGPARLRAIGDGDSLFLQAGTATSNNGNLILSGLFGQNLTSCRVQMAGGLHNILHGGMWSDAVLLSRGMKVMLSPGANIATGGQPSLEVRAETGAGAAYMKFERPGQYGALFGVDSDGQWKVGGVSMGQIAYRLWHEGNLDATRLLAYRPEHDHLHPNDRPRGLSSGDNDIGSGLKGWAYWTHMRPGNTYGAQMAVSDTAEEVWVRRKSDSNWQAWHQIHTTATFNPATKVDVFNPDGWPHTISLGWNGDRMVARVDASVAHHLVHQGDAASAGDAIAGSAADRFITPAALWSFAKSIGPSGYAQIPGTPIIMQWGSSTGSLIEGQVTALLPIAFGGGCFFAAATPRNASSEPWADFMMQVVAKYLDRIIFFAQRGYDGRNTSSGYEWLALGFATGTPNAAFSAGGGTGGGGGGGGEFNPEL